jgi:Spy/CpxP family protein refolding chaperone
MKYSSHRTGLSVLLLAAVLLTSVSAFAGGQRHRGRHGDVFRTRMADELGITAEQRQRIDAIRAEHSEAIKAARENVADKRRALEEAYAAEPVDKATVDARLQELGDAQEALMQRASEVRLAIHDVLTPEQRAKARELRAKGRERFKERRKAWGDRAPN